VPKFQLLLVLYFSQACLQHLSKVPHSCSSRSLHLCPSCHPALCLRSYIKGFNHFYLIFIQDEIYGSSFIFLHADIQFSQQHFLKRLSFLRHLFWVTLSNVGGHSCMDSNLGLLFCSIGFHVCFCVCHHRSPDLRVPLQICLIPLTIQ
jgi:hypothetical protein